MPSRVADQTLITCALAVLDDAAYRSRSERVQTPGVRLALRTLLPHIGDRAGLLSYWEAAGTAPRNVESPCRQPYFVIAKALRDRGWDAPV